MTNKSSDANLPAHARERLRGMRAHDGKAGLFTSDLSVNEFLLVKEAGFEPVGLVMGCSIYHIGFQFRRWTQNEELKVLTTAMYHARELAMTRMETEAHALGADGIIGVRLVVKPLEWNDSLAEFMAIGTAVTHPNSDVNYKTAAGKPFTSDLSGQDFWTMLQAGYRPVGLVMGNCVYHVAHNTVGQFLKNIGQNVEMTNFTQALYDARELAMERMQAEAKHLGAEGIVGVEIKEHSYRWSAHVIEFFSVGTAVVAMRSDHHIPTPQLVLNVND
jgi:uncharacterized protein YbjQ (UPF0145 family)